jgi:hypothetical protein
MGGPEVSILFTRNTGCLITLKLVSRITTPMGGITTPDTKLPMKITSRIVAREQGNRMNIRPFFRLSHQLHATFNLSSLTELIIVLSVTEKLLRPTTISFHSRIKGY